MQAPRGLSAEDKRVKLLEIFHETRDFYQLKELEKLGPKMKGIVSQSVKDVLQSLVDDGLVQADKIGSSNFFWSFPSQHGVLVQAKLDKIKESGNTHRSQIVELEHAIEAARAERIESDMRTKKLKKLGELKKDLAALESELSAYGDSNPAKVEEVKRAAFLAKEAAYRWTDNYGVLLGHFTRQNGISPEDIRQFLSISEDYEDLE
ncbi:meiotic nuclear division protein 1 [Pholiota conissans]|uniref:Meiotic nuclear division protein 1 n=1 Tax=Pholiota conissans TaxID=109636 RepID=A0A9P6CP50_9AGAR|nr:meiotic nuclear division protein 1 [Pholiota conissans]